MVTEQEAFMSLHLAPGQTIRRTDLHQSYGGRRQGGISPSRATPNVFVITAPARGETYGYVYDGWGEDGYFHYTGEGQLGDQQMKQGNKTIREHEQQGRELHVLEADGTELTYIGQFRFHDYYEADAPDVGDDPATRKVIVFRLEQLSGERRGPVRSRLDRLGHDRVKEVPVEQYLTERTLIEGAREPYESERREQNAVLAFATFLQRAGHDVCRLQLRPDGEAAPLFCDIFDKTTRTLYEAKGTVTRPALRMAIGQLLDYGRFVEQPFNQVILLPEAPRADLLALAASQDIAVVWPASDGTWTSTPPPHRDTEYRATTG
ncbi:MAG: hypothetical protein WKF96_03410 [Solirubrobacteraceae bacterium]